MLSTNLVLRSTDAASRFQGLHRVLHINRASSEVVLIEIPMPTAEAPAPYFRSPFRARLPLVEGEVREAKLAVTTIDPSPLVSMSDEEIAKRFPPRRRKDRTKFERSAPLRTRDRLFALVEPFLHEQIALGPAVFEGDFLAQWVVMRAKAVKCAPKSIHNALNRLLAYGYGRQSLLPGFIRCGHAGKERVAKERPLGRPNALSTGPNAIKVGYVMTPECKKKVRECWDRFVDGKRSVPEAYSLAMGVYWSNGTVIYQGKAIPKLLPAHLRPTESQFRNWGPGDEPGKAAWERLLMESDLDNNYRGSQGTVRDGIDRVGHVAQADCTSNDVNLVRVDDPLQNIGPATRCVIKDPRSEVITGFAFDLGGASANLALAAVLNSAEPHIEFCAAYGVAVTEEEFPHAFYRKYLVDNGEFRALPVRETLHALGSAVELVAKKRARRKGSVEADHRVIHKLLDHKVSGTTRGRQRKRGESDTRLDACWNAYEYVRQLILAIIYHNTKRDAEHLLTLEMRRDKVAPTRAAIHAWYIKNDLVAHPPVDLTLLRARVLPKMRAVVRDDGIFLLRPDAGERDIHIPQARFLGQRAIELQWLDRARRTGSFTIEVHGNKFDLKRLWYVDAAGTHEFRNVSEAKLAREATLPDLLAMARGDLEQRVSHRGEEDQKRLNFTYDREQVDEAAVTRKEEALSQLPRKPSKASQVANVRENRDAEKASMAKRLDPQTRTPRAGWEVEAAAMPASPSVVSDDESTPSNLQRDADVSIVPAQGRTSVSTGSRKVNSLRAWRARRDEQ